MPVKQVSSDADYSYELSSTKDKLVVVDFFATWCGPCKAVAHPYELLSEKYHKGAKFLKVDVDQLQSTSQSAGVSAMPTFHVYRNRQLLGSVSGANLMEVENIILNNYKEVEAFVGTGNKLGANAGTSDSGNPFNLLFQRYSAQNGLDDNEELIQGEDGEVEVQIRLWDKTIYKAKVLKSSKLSELKDIVQELPNCPSNFNLASNFPKKEYKGELLDRTIYQEKLHKNGQLIVHTF